MNDTRPEAAFEALASKAGLLWVSRVGAGPAPVWFGWHEGAIHVVVGGAEQPDPFADGEEVWVTVPSKDTGASAGLAHVRPENLSLDSPQGQAAAEALAAKRLNSTSGDLVATWRANDSRVLRLEVTEVVAEVANDAVGGRQPVTIEQVSPRLWRPMRAHARRKR